jgi:ornithine carbamoyltransferase
MLHITPEARLAHQGTPRHFLDIADLDAATLRRIVDKAHELKRVFKSKTAAKPRPAQDRVLAMLFEKTSTRTRVSFDVAMRNLGGETIVLNHSDMQLGRGEPIADTARVLSRYVDAIMMRTTSHATLMEMAENADVPVINGLSDRSHPCQILADVMTLEEHKGDITKLTAAWVGDSNNVATSWIHAATRFGFTLRVASPSSLQPDPALLAWAASNGGRIEVTDDPSGAAAGADCVVTDVWVSMGHTNAEERMKLLEPYQVDDALMEKAGPGAIFMHCLPAQRGQEVTASVIDGPQSVVFDEAENRLHAQRAILAWCFETV